VKLISFNELLRRGWRAPLIWQFMPEPDKTHERLTFYDLERVEKIEQSDGFKLVAYLSKFKKLSKRAREERDYKRKKKRELVNEARNRLPVKFEKIPYEDLKAEALAAFKKNFPGKEPPYVERLCVNHLRHCLSRYEHYIHDKYEGKPGSGAARLFVFVRIMIQIMKSYPELRQEAYHQMRLRKMIGTFKKFLIDNGFPVDKIDGKTVFCPWNETEE
jgi:hypothetical protein